MNDIGERIRHREQHLLLQYDELTSPAVSAVDSKRKFHRISIPIGCDAALLGEYLTLSTSLVENRPA